MVRRLKLLPSLLLAAALAAQTVPDENGVAASVVLPPKLEAGQPATLAVLAADGRLTPGISVDLSGGQKVTTDVTGRASFTAPTEPGVLLAQLPGTTKGAAGVVIPTRPPARVTLARVPVEISVRDRFVVSGFGFRGEADANRVWLGGRRALVLAASPAALVVLPGPGAQAGTTQIVVETGGAAATAPTTVVALELDSKGRSVAPKEKATLVMRVRGTEHPQLLEARNLSPRVVRFSRGDFEWLTTSGGAENTASIEMEGLSLGDFSFRVRLVPAAAGPPDVEAARQLLLAAGTHAPPGAGRRVANMIHRLDHLPPDVQKANEELGKILASQPAGEFDWLLVAARDALLNR